MSLQGPSEHLGIFITVMVVSAIFLFDFGWFREQFCIIACPYGRMQSVIMDENSLIVAYDKKRGEPRRGQSANENEGDCINCYACVKVCPTGIDIRRGTQLECIACTNCIDACDEIMDKIQKPHGLIKYSSEIELKGKDRKKLTTRSIAYLIILISLITVLVYYLSHIKSPHMVFIRGSDAPFIQSQSNDGSKFITNHFTLKISHQGDESLHLDLAVNDPDLQSQIEIISPLKNLKIESPDIKTMVFFKFKPQILINGSKTIQLNLLKNNSVVASEEITLVGPNL